jgi:hypothetical protein
LGIGGYLPPDSGLTKVHLRLGCDFGYGFLQIRHWLSTIYRVSFEELVGVSFDTLAFTYIFSPFKAMTGLSPVRLSTIPVAPPLPSGEVAAKRRVRGEGKAKDQNLLIFGL